MVDAVAGRRSIALLTASVCSEKRRQGHQVCQAQTDATLGDWEKWTMDSVPLTAHLKWAVIFNKTSQYRQFLFSLI